MRTKSKQIKLLCLLFAVYLIYSGCKKQNSALTTSLKATNLTQHGLGVILDRKAFLNAPKVDVDAIKSYFILNNITPKFEQYTISKLQTQTINGDPNLPATVILPHPAIGDQGQTNTCLSWAVGYCDKEVLDMTWSNSTADNGLRSGWYLYNTIFSTPQYAANSYGCYVNDNPISYGGMGLYTVDALSYATRFGVSSASTEPSFAACSPAPSTAATTSAATDKAASYGAVTNYLTAKQLLAAGVPVVFAFSFFNDFTTAFDNGTTWNTTNSPASGSGHAICFIGYDDAHSAFLAQNSWGAGGGDVTYPGCVWVSYGVVMQLLAEGRNNGGAEAYALQPISNTAINTYANTQQYETFTPNNCASGTIPNPSQINYIVPAGKYTSPVSVSAANQMAINDVLTNGQAYANAHLVGCTVPTPPPANYTFTVSPGYGIAPSYSITVNGVNITGGTKTGGGTVYDYNAVNSKSTVVVQVLSGTMTKTAVLEGPFTVYGTISGNTVTFTNVPLTTGGGCGLLLN